MNWSHAILLSSVLVIAGCGSASEGAGDDIEAAVTSASTSAQFVTTTTGVLKVSLAETLGGGPCGWPSEVTGPALTMVRSWYRTTSGRLLELLASGEPSTSDPQLGTVVPVTDFELLSNMGGESTAEIAVADDVASRLGDVAADETVLLGVGSIGNAVTVAVVRHDGEAAFVGDCALEMQTLWFRDLADYLREEPADLLTEIALGRDVQRAIDEMTLRSLRPTPWEDRDPSHRQFDPAETPREILEDQALVVLRISLPPGWRAEPFVLCTRVPMAWNQCGAMQAADPDGTLTLNAFYDPSGSDNLEFHLFESSPSWSIADGLLLGHVAAADLVDGHDVDVVIDSDATGAEMFATAGGSEIGVDLDVRDGGPRS